MVGQATKAGAPAKVHGQASEAPRTKKVSGPNRERHYHVRFPAPPHSGRVVLEVEGLAKSYGGPPVFSDVEFALERGERLLVLGLNGAGKTSMLRILAGVTG